VAAVQYTFTNSTQNTEDGTYIIITRKKRKKTITRKKLATRKY
jgi:hypothetical protein